MKKIVIIFSAFLSISNLAMAEEKSLVNELDSLNSPANEMPGSIDGDKLYAVQTRYSSLRNRLELTAGGGQKISDTGFMTTRDFNVGTRFYFDSKWSVGASYSQVNNQFTETAQRLLDKQGIVADLPYVNSRADLTARYNLFYGKFRVSMDRVLYFDQYISVGPAMIGMSNGNAIGGVVDLGLAFWIGSKWSARIGVKDYIYQETALQAPASQTLRNNVSMYVDMGFLFGKGV